ncbi:MAG: WYL domain-containing protein [Nocardioidaceae bacterium]
MSTANTGARDQMRRLLALVPYLQTRDSVSVQQVAADFGVSEQRIRADLRVLWFCGLPGLGMGDLIDIDMEALEGEDVIRLSNADYLTRPLRLDTTEAAALMVALRTLREGSDHEERPIVDRAIAKIEAAAGPAAALAQQVQVLAPPETVETGFEAAHDDLLVTVSLGREARWVVDYYPTESVEPSGDGLRATLRVSDPAWLVRLMLRLGRSGRIVSPPELQSEVREAAQRALRAYERLATYDGDE